MSTMGVWDWALVVAGVLALSVGLTALWAQRLHAALDSDRAGPANAPPADRVLPGPPRVRMSEPTRLSFGVVGVIWGYHLIAWGLPAGWMDFRVPSHFWPWMAGVALVWLGGSLVMDARDGRRAGTQTDRSPLEPPDRNPN